MDHIRNIAIIAHIDHGKTTLVDKLLQQAGTFRSNEAVEDRVMDSMDLEREKGITIKAKNASFQYKEHHVNIVDTPGHADFGGEVERIMKMIDGVVLLTDAFEGPQAQTKFVLKKALAVGHRPIVMINKVDRDNARPLEVLDMVFDLFLDLGATDEQLDFPVIYGSGKDGYATKDWQGEVTQEMRDKGMEPLYDLIVEHVPAPEPAEEEHFHMLIASLDYNDYVGRIGLGKILNGSIKVGDPMVCLKGDGSVEKGKVTKIYGASGLRTIELEEASAGMIVGLAGLENIFIGETLVDDETRTALPFVEIDPPTINMQFVVNDSPFAGKEGKFLTARHIKDRLTRETRINVGLTFSETDAAGVFEVNARGEMQVAILVEQMRREGFELLISRPQVIIKTDENGKKLEPYESLYVNVPSENLGDVLQNLNDRKADIVNMEHHENTVSVDATIPTRGLLGFGTDLLNLTRGMGIMSHLFKEYGESKGEIRSRKNGVLIALEPGSSTAYALDSLQDRARLFIGPGEEIYLGMIVGENSRQEDMVVNPCKAKQLTNMRSSGDGKGIMLEPPISMSLERMLEYISADEYVEATPGSLRIRKKILDHNARKRSEKNKG